MRTSGGGGAGLWRKFSFGPGSTAAIKGSHSPCVSACNWGALDGLGLLVNRAFEQRLSGQGPSSERVGATQRDIFCLSSSEHGEADVSRPKPRGGCWPTEATGSHSNPIPGTLWRFRQSSRSWIFGLADGSDHELPSGRQCPSSEGQLGADVRMSRTGSHGSGQFEPGVVAGFGGGPSVFPVFSSVPCSIPEPSALCPIGQSTVGDSCSAVSSRDGLDHNSKGRSCTERRRARIDHWRGPQFRESTSKTEPKEKGQGQREVIKERGGGGAVKGPSPDGCAPPDDAEFDCTIDFPRFCASLVRWVLRSRTKFSAFLSRTFFIQPLGTCPDTAVFPLPVPCFGLFGAQRTPRLGVRRWRKICLQRTVHVLAMALNFIYNNMQPPPIGLLGRRPNLIQRGIFLHLRALVSACDRPGDCPMPPGRSGFDFIARLVELEKFTADNPDVSHDLYAGISVPGTLPKVSAGWIDERHRFKTSTEFSPANPYRSLDAGRLKLSGCGQWPMSDHLDSFLWLPFQEPKILEHHLDVPLVGPNVKYEDRAENLKLLKLWDARGLLALFHEPHDSGLSCRVFNNHKNSEIDRQIGDRRWFNGLERHPSGPSSVLPSGHAMTSLHCPRGYFLAGCTSDRRDFYHQAEVSREKALSNIMPFAFPADEFTNSPALSALHDELSRPTTREQHGDRLGMTKRKRLCPDDIQLVYGGFKSLFQGDHLGVEYALESHNHVLKTCGLLSDASTILQHSPFPAGPLWECLVIDDYCVISCEPEKGNSKPRSVEHLEKAEEVYALEGIIGSDEKTVRGEKDFKVIGAEVQSSDRTRGLGFTLVGAPFSKRLALATLSLRAAALPQISRALASRISGAWTSVLMFRRCLCSVLGGIFSLGSRTTGDSGEVLYLPRSVAEEITLASVLMLVAVTDVSVPYDSRVYATDASMNAGAIVSKEVGNDLSRTLWLGGDRKGCYTMLDSPARAMLRTIGDDLDQLPSAAEIPSIGKTIDFCFDVVEVCGGSGTLSKALAHEGLNVCMPIDISYSRHFDFKNVMLLNWLLHMMKERRILAVICEPPCTTFSAAQHPASRSYSNPLGHDRKDAKTWLGNCLAFRCLTLIWYALRCGLVGLLEQPKLSKMAWLSAWKFLLQLGCEEAFIASCSFGSIHKKEFRMLGTGLEMKELHVPCTGGHSHVRIEGVYTKPSAIYVPELATFLAKKIKVAIDRIKAKDADFTAVGGHESVVLNDLLMQSGWRVDSAWEWKAASHINILESRSYVALAKDLVIKGGRRRFCALLDSRVAKGSHSKGRSSSLALRPGLLRGCALSICGNIYPSFGFAPTRLNTADAPTRSRDLPEPAECSILDGLTSQQVAQIRACQLTRAAAGWIRLYILVSFCFCPGESCLHFDFGFQNQLGSRSCYAGRPCLNDGLWTFASCLTWLLDVSWRIWTRVLSVNPFCLSFGSSCVILCLFIFLAGILRQSRFLTALTLSSWIFFPMHIPGSSLSCSAPLGLGFGICCSCFQLSHGVPLGPQNCDERTRAARRVGVQLQADRIVLQQTRSRRENLLQCFDAWLTENVGTTVEDLLSRSLHEAEYISETLVAYGKDMYQSGKAYNRYAETINAVTSRKPGLRRQLCAAWDLAFNWIVDEPHEHNAALPLSLALAIATLALLWGWIKEAAIILMCWSGVLRIGEIFQATREDLILPQDAAPGVWYALLKNRLPKTRGRAAKHQSSRIDSSDVVQLLTATYGKMPSSARLWPLSPATLRKRFAALQLALGITKPGKPKEVPYSLGSLRPGGATYWLQTTEDSEYVRRKGRWISAKVFEIYIQEAAVATFNQRLSEETKQRVDSLSKNFSVVLQKAIFFKSVSIPEICWPKLWWCRMIGRSGHWLVVELQLVQRATRRWMKKSGQWSLWFT